MTPFLFMHKIVDYIFICDRQKTNLNELEDENIKGMLYLYLNTNTNRSISTLNDYTEIGIHHYHIEIVDDKKLDFTPYIQRIVNIIRHFETKKLNILIYCDTGTRLSPIAVITYILYKIYVIDGFIPKNHPITPSLLKKVQEKNSDIDYHNMHNAIQQLVKYEIELKQKNIELRKGVKNY